MIYYVNFFVLKNSLLLENKISNKKYQKSSLSMAMQERLIVKLEVAMQEQKIYKNPSLDLKTLAQNIHASPHHLSQVLNEKLNKTYYEWIAEYRVEEAKILLKKDCYQHLRLEEIGKMAGFNSKSAFYKAFKKFEGSTPASFRKL